MHCKNKEKKNFQQASMNTLLNPNELLDPLTLCAVIGTELMKEQIKLDYFGCAKTNM